LTQIQPTPFKDGIPRDSWWYWFKFRHPKISTRLAKGLEISKGGGLTKKCMHFFLLEPTNNLLLAQLHCKT